MATDRVMRIKMATKIVLEEEWLGPTVFLDFLVQNCDLLGSDLQHANLRGANIAGTNLQDVVI